MRAASIGPRPTEPVAGPSVAGPGWFVRSAPVAALAVAVIAVLAAWRSPGFSATSQSIPSAALVVGAGLAVVAAGVEHVRRGRRRPFGLVLAAAGIAWLVADWANPAIGSPIGFTIGLVFGWLAPALVAHALLTFGDVRRDRLSALLLASGYIVFGGLLGLIPAVAFDARAIHCSLCPADLVAVLPSSELLGGSMAIGTIAATAWSVVVVVALGLSFARQTAAGRSFRLPVFVPGAVFMSLVAVEFGRIAGRTVVPSDGPMHVVRLAEAAALALLAVGAGVEWVRAWRSRAHVARVVADLAHSPPLGGLREALAATLNDPGLLIAYPLPGNRYVDATGQDVVFDPGSGPARRITSIAREGQVVALLQHRADVLEAPETVNEVVRAARLGLEHERLQAESRAQLTDLRAARRRIVATAGEERRRLERDLHDGAQQQLIAISIGLRLLAGEAPGRTDRSAELIAEAGRELGLAIDAVREVAHGIYPTILADEGLAAAIESVAEGAAVPVTIGELQVDPVDAPIGEAAHAVVAEIVGAADGPIRVHGSRSLGQLIVVVEAGKVPHDVLVEIGDRIGAVDGTLATTDRDGRLEVRAEIPCAS